MTQLTLLTKAQNAGILKQTDRLLKDSFKDLDVEIRDLDVVGDRWIRVTLSGEDEAIATNFIRKEIGICPESLERTEQYATLKGYVINFGKNPEELQIDIGVFQPEPCYAAVPLKHLQATLVDGRKLALKKIAELFAFCDNLPTVIRVVAVDNANKRIEAEFAAAQLEKFAGWRQSLLDRLIVLGTSIHVIRRTLNQMGLDRDVVSVEPLGLFEHVLTCKLGTDAAGLISRVGRSLRDAKFVVFNPRKIMEFLGTNPE